MTDGRVNYGEHARTVCLTPMVMDENEETMGQRIARLSDAKALSQSELARRLGVTRATVHQWWHDTSPNIRPANLLGLASLLGTDVHYLVFGKNRQPDGGFPKPPPTGPTPGGDTSTTGSFKSPFRRPRST
jgi:DNA-binding transcriptional regulator YiaG